MEVDAVICFYIIYLMRNIVKKKKKKNTAGSYCSLVCSLFCEYFKKNTSSVIEIKIKSIVLYVFFACIVF